MPTKLRLERHLEILARAGADLHERAGNAGLDARVITCPAWTVAELVGHLGAVHRWAVANLTGSEHDRAATLQEAASSEDLLEWFAKGLDELSVTLRDVPEDVEAMVFLRDAPPPRRFWARRQTHETFIHGIDVLAAELGRLPTAAEGNIPPDIAVDGLDELLFGFLTRRRNKIELSGIQRLTVTATDTGESWTLHLGEERVTTVTGSDESADAVLSGPAAALYLGLWNRGDEFDGPAEIRAGWRRQATI